MAVASMADTPCHWINKAQLLLAMYKMNTPILYRKQL